MVGLGVFELLIVGVMLLGAMVLVRALFGGTAKGGGGFHLGHAMLNCPHCNAETPATEGQCRHCGKPFT